MSRRKGFTPGKEGRVDAARGSKETSMTVHLAQVAAVQGAVLFLWDLDEQSGVCAGIGILRDGKAEPGRLVRVSYDGERPIAAESASETELTPGQRAVMLPAEPDAEARRLYKLIWEDA